MTKDLRGFTHGWRRVLTHTAVAAAVSAGVLASLGTAQADESADGPTPTIIGGDKADQDYPFMTSLQWKKDGDPNAHHCGGALIRDNWVVTGAHCVTEAGKGSDPYTVLDPELFHVRVGSNDRTAGGSVAKLQKIEVHPDYQWLEDRELGKDIALLKLDRKLSQRPIAPVTEETEPGTKVRAVGWGYTSNDDNDPSKLPKELRQLDTEILPPSTKKCRVDPEEGDAWGIREGDVCADNPEGTRGACGGDSGSPLLTKAGGEWRLAGVDSRGVGNTCGKSPEIYTSADHYRDWITSVTG